MFIVFHQHKCEPALYVIMIFMKFTIWIIISSKAEKSVTAHAHHDDKYSLLFLTFTRKRDPCQRHIWAGSCDGSFVSNELLLIMGGQLYIINTWLISLKIWKRASQRLLTGDCLYCCNVTLYYNHKRETLYYRKTIMPQKKRELQALLSYTRWCVLRTSSWG